MATHRGHHVRVHVHIGNKSGGASKRRGRKRGGKRRTGYAGAKLGSGKNFRALKSDLARRGAKNPGALAAYIGRRAHGNKAMAKWSAQGRRRAAGRRRRR